MRDVSSSRLVPASLALWLQPFREGFTAPTWEHVLVLIVGSILTPGRRTVAAALRVVGFEQAMDFANYHRVLNRNRWSSRWVARCLFRVLVNNLVLPITVGQIRRGAGIRVTEPRTRWSHETGLLSAPQLAVRLKSP